MMMLFVRTRHFILAAGIITLGLYAKSAFAQPTFGFFKNYFVTGDYVVGGVGLRGLGDATGYATGSIAIPDTTQTNSSAVPAGANIVAAFLYWQTVEKSQTQYAGQRGFFNGYPIVGKVLGNPNAPVSWSSGGCAGSSQGTTTLRAYRADVRPYLKQGGNGTYQVRLTDSGSNGGGVPLTLGASLVIIYRVLPSSAVPLKAVVVYDGSFAPSNTAQSMTQSIGGFYQAGSQVATITHIVGNGQANKGEQVSLNSVALPSLYPGLPPFPGFYNGSWDNPTWTPANYSGTPLNINDLTATTTVLPSATNSGCVSWGAIIFGVLVPDSDNDGLLDVWETNQGYTDFGTGQFVALPQANPGVKDIFVQIDYMNNTGIKAGEIAHSHLPKEAALDMVGNAFARAPVDCASGVCKGIRVHFDVGNNYQCPAGSATCAQDPFIIAGGTGGNIIDEDIDTCADIPSKNFYCQYPNQTGVTGWKSGVTMFKNQPLNTNPDGSPWTEAQCSSPGTYPNPCIRRFQYGRKDSYHNVFFGHNLAAPDATAITWNIRAGSLLSVACCTVPTGVAGNTIVTTATSAPVPFTAGARITILTSLASFTLNTTYVVQQVLSPTSFTITTTSVPAGTYGPASGFSDPSLTVSYLPAPPIPVRSISGWSDLPGADTIVTLGSWLSDFVTENQTGSVQVQAGTLMHEIGHTLGLTHGGAYYAPGGTTPSYGHNCKPNYQSIMNYMFQIRGLTNGAVDYSGQVLANLAESSLLDSAGLVGVDMGLAQYGTTRWYAPLGFFQTMVQITQDSVVSAAATMHCDGTPITGGSPMFKIEGLVKSGGLMTPIDWNNDGFHVPTPPVDVNYSGSTGDSFVGFNDWATLDLRQIGARRNALAFSGGMAGSDLALGGGSELILGGGTDLSLGGGTDLSSGGGNDLASGGGTDLSLGGGSDLALGGGSELSLGGGSEVDFGLANSTVDPPTNVTAVAIKANNALITWNPPGFGQIRTYYVWRANTTGGVPISPANPPTNIGKVTVTPPVAPGTTYSFTDLGPKTKNTYTYFVTSVTGDKRSSGPSNFSSVSF